MAFRPIILSPVILTTFRRIIGINWKGLFIIAAAQLNIRARGDLGSQPGRASRRDDFLDCSEALFEKIINVSILTITLMTHVY